MRNLTSSTSGFGRWKRGIITVGVALFVLVPLESVAPVPSTLPGKSFEQWFLEDEMKIKSGSVSLEGLSPEMFFYLGRADEMFQHDLGEEFVLTNAVAQRAYPSKHTQGKATDGRTRDHFDWELWRHKPEMVTLALKLREQLDPLGYDTVLEPDFLNDHDIVKRFSDEKLQSYIGHTNRQEITEEQLEILRRKIFPHIHAEHDPKQGEVLWARVN